MLEAFIIDELLKRERQDDRYRPQPRLDLPLPHPCQAPYSERPSPPSPYDGPEDHDDGRENGVIILDM